MLTLPKLSCKAWKTVQHAWALAMALLRGLAPWGPREMLPSSLGSMSRVCLPVRTMTNCRPELATCCSRSRKFPPPPKRPKKPPPPPPFCCTSTTRAAPACKRQTSRYSALHAACVYILSPGMVSSAQAAKSNCTVHCKMFMHKKGLALSANQPLLYPPATIVVCYIANEANSKQDLSLVQAPTSWAALRMRAGARVSRPFGESPGSSTTVALLQSRCTSAAVCLSRQMTVPAGECHDIH